MEGNKVINEKPNCLVFDPELAAHIGLNEAIVIHQIEYWLDKYKDDSAHIKDGKVWVYNTYEDWQAQFPFWSFHTIRNIFKKMLEKGYLIRGNYNRLNIDRTYWYTINEESIKSEVSKCGTSKCQDVADGSANMWQTNTIEYTETTKTKNTVSIVSSFDKQKDDHIDDNLIFVNRTLPSMLSRIYMEAGNHLLMTYPDCLNYVKRFLKMRRCYANDEYRLTLETLRESVNGIELFWEYCNRYDYEVDYDIMTDLMDRWFDVKSNLSEQYAFSLNQLCHQNMLCGLYGDEYRIPEFSWEGNGEITQAAYA